MNKRRRIYLMRHGEVAYFSGAGPDENQVTGELTERGREQAKATGRELRGARFDRVVTSGLPRTVTTARLVLAEARADPLPEIESWPGLEEFRGGTIERIASDDVDDAFLPIFHGVPERDDAFLGGETVGSIVDRVNGALDRLLAADDWETILLVLHGGSNRAILSRALTGQPMFLGHIEQSAGCFNVIDVEDDWWFVRAVNITTWDLAHAAVRTSSIEDLAAEYRAYRGWD
jgi:probable phosphoglycerate mutase